MSAKKLRLNGRQKSVSVAKLSQRNESVKQERLLKKLLAHTFDTFAEEKDPSEYARKKADFVFHMRDWNSDLEMLAQIYEHPDRFDKKTGRQFIFGFLVHVIPHLNAAGRLMLGEIVDPFAKP